MYYRVLCYHKECFPSINFEYTHKFKLCAFLQWWVHVRKFHPAVIFCKEE